MKTRKILFLAGLTLTTILIIELIKRKKTEKKQALIAEEGYETAGDILFPERKFLRIG